MTKHLLTFVACLLILRTTAQAGQETFKLTPSEGESGDIFGKALALAGKRAIVGAERSNEYGDNSGSAYLFDLDTGERTAKLLPDDGAAYDYFGYSVATDGQLALVGAYGRSNDGNGVSAGAAFLYDALSGRELAKILPDDGAAGAQFGHSVLLSDTLVLVGAPSDVGNGAYSGAVYVFDLASLQQIAKFTPEDLVSGSLFSLWDELNKILALPGNINLDNQTVLWNRQKNICHQLNTVRHYEGNRKFCRQF